MVEKDKIEILRDLLFTNDRAYVEKIVERIVNIEKTVEDKERYHAEIKPIIKNQLNDFKKDLPATITAALKVEISTHKDEVADVLFPILGKMIKKYVSQEIKLLTHKINDQIGVTGWKNKMKLWFTKGKKGAHTFENIDSFQIEQVFLIEKQSGFLEASYSNNPTVDEDIISGMLTAIKIFVEDAFGSKSQSLEHIEYELSHIHIQSFMAYYLAVVVSGHYTLKAKNKVQDLIFNFYDDYMQKKVKGGMDRATIEIELKNVFGSEQP